MVDHRWTWKWVPRLHLCLCLGHVWFLHWTGSPSPRLCWLPSLFSRRSEQSEPTLWPEPPACQTEGCSSRSASPTTWQQRTRTRQHVTWVEWYIKGATENNTVGGTASTLGLWGIKIALICSAKTLAHPQTHSSYSEVSENLLKHVCARLFPGWARWLPGQSEASRFPLFEVFMLPS